jgi:hypothetical protein
MQSIKSEIISRFTLFWALFHAFLPEVVQKIDLLAFSLSNFEAL